MENYSTLHNKPKFKELFAGELFEVVSFEGKPGFIFEVAIRPPGVRLLIETYKDGEKALLMTREIRREADGYDFRLPGGKVFNTLNQMKKFCYSDRNLHDMAKYSGTIEGREEVGIHGGRYTEIHVSKAGSSVEWDLYYFKVEDAHIGERDLEESEVGDIEAVCLNVKEIFELLTTGQIKEGRSAHVLWQWMFENGFIKFK